MANEILQAPSPSYPLGTLSILPSEIRQAIYVLSIGPTAIEFCTEGRDLKQNMKLSPGKTINLLQTSRPIRQESITTICHYKVITIKTKDSLTEFINTVMEQNSGTGTTHNLLARSIHHRHLKIDLTNWLCIWRHTAEGVLRRQCKGYQMTHYLQPDLETELNDWAKRLIGLCGRARSKLTFKVVFPTMLDHLDFRTPTKSFLKRIATRYYMATRS